MRAFDPGSRRALEWRVAVAWVALLASLLALPGTSSTDPYLLRHPLAAMIADFGLATLSLVLTARPLLYGGAGMRSLAAACALFATLRISGWLAQLLIASAGRRDPF